MRAYEEAGECFRAYDEARRGLEQHPDDLDLKHRAVLALARSGALELASRMYRELELDASSSSEVRALGARLLKDRALRLTGPQRRVALRKAASAYEAIYAETKEHYPGVNTATLYLLAGDRARAMKLARVLLAGLQRSKPSGQPQEEYYRLASRIEAHLILREIEPARALSPVALEAAGGDFGALSTTWRQLRLVMRANQLDASWLAEHGPPAVIHYVGHLIAPKGREGRFHAADEGEIRRRIEEVLRPRRVGFGYGSLASGADILCAEALLQRETRLHVVLPFSAAEFVDVSVRPAGADWVRRFEHCLARAESVRYATEDAYLNDDRLFAYCSDLAMGLAVLRAQQLGSEVEQVAIWDGERAGGIAGTARDVARWRRKGLPQIVVRCGHSRPRRGRAPRTTAPASGRLPRAMLFCDVRGFSKLTDAELPRYVGGLLRALARTLDRSGRKILFRNTWGDGLFLVFASPGAAADCALALQETLQRLNLQKLGLPAHLAVRVGGHLGPAYPAVDPILGKMNYFGAHVSRAARIEPVTPEGCVYVTETFAAALALDHGEEFTCEYVGMTQAAKGYGAMRMFLLGRGRRRKGGPRGPPQSRGLVR